LGFQDLASSFFGGSKEAVTYWNTLVTKNINRLAPQFAYQLLTQETMGSVHMMIFTKKSVVVRLGDIASCSVKTSTLGIGNTGANVVRFSFDDTSFCVLNVNLPYGDQKSDVSRRHATLNDVIQKAFKSERD